MTKEKPMALNIHEIRMDFRDRSNFTQQSSEEVPKYDTGLRFWCDAEYPLSLTKHLRIGDEVLARFRLRGKWYLLPAIITYLSSNPDSASYKEHPKMNVHMTGKLGKGVEAPNC